ncbi:hypothetical protein CC78DRAFT_586745 [Lojkania enalia]|uniref:Uncharacterized protein n=1 Tax=Lojkania enalia TaxID=147567 RepID=A0A9P4N4V1_9PLEO|nr:hypothetical protein CC78DRAFT_586745 [Didymosphaeria enalia]
MALLGLKAIDYAAEKIPDKLFEKIPGGFFTPSDKKKKSHKNREARYQSEHRQSDRDRRRSIRDRTPPTDYSDYSDYDDTDYETEYSRQRRRRAKSLGRRVSRDTSFSRGRDRHRSRDVEGEMDRTERGPEFPPPPGGDWRPYNPADYPPPTAATGSDYYDRRTSSARPDYGYPPQVNTNFRPRSATVPSAPMPSSAGFFSPLMARRTPTNLPINAFRSDPLALSSRGSPLQTAFSPSYEPPLASLLQHSGTNSPQPQSQPMNPRPSTGGSTSAARYTPAAGYAPSPGSTPLPPQDQGYAPYNPADYASPGQTPYRAPGNAYPSPPPFYRQQSRSQPSLAPNSDNQLTYYNPPPHLDNTSSSRRHRNGDDKRHRARSASHRRSGSRVTDQLRGRYDNLDSREKDLAASAAGAAIGGIGGRELERRHEKKLRGQLLEHPEGESQVEVVAVTEDEITLGHPPANDEEKTALTSIAILIPMTKTIDEPQGGGVHPAEDGMTTS